MDASSSFAALADEELVARAINTDGQAAFDVLTLRYREWLEHWVARLCQKRHFRPEEQEDAQQEIIIGFFQAVRSFDPAQIRAGQDHPFQTFVFQVIRRRFLSFARAVDRDRKRFGQSLDSLEGMDAQAYQLPGLVGCGKPSARVGQDPASLAEDAEDEERFAAAVQQLSERHRRVCEAICNRVPLRRIAEQYGVTVAAVWYWRQQMTARLHKALREKSHTE
jgi:RNA polymerase sigma factor (sigma-70 family)